MAPGLKDCPDNDTDNLLPPIDQYTTTQDGRQIIRRYLYFENGHEHPFEFACNRYSLLNAWWLGDVAMLTYSDEEKIRASCVDGGFMDFQFFSGESTQCYLASRKEYAFVAFRGTQAPKRGQHLSDVA